MKSKLLFITLLTFSALFSYSYAFTDISTIKECTACIGTGFVCKDNVVDFRSYCCATGETSAGCKRDYCSNQAQTASMRLTFCPFQWKSCSTPQSEIQINQLNTWTTLVNDNLRFVNESICYWMIQPDPKVFNVDQGGYYYNI